MTTPPQGKTRSYGKRSCAAHQFAAIVHREQPRTGEAVADTEAGHAGYVAEPDLARAQLAAVARRFSRPSRGGPAATS